MQREPSYQGKRLSLWLSDLDLMSDSSPQTAQLAVRAIGTNGIPVLLGMLRKTDPLWKRAIIAFNEQQSVIQLPIVPAITTRQRAVQGFAALGVAAKEQVAPLIQMMESEPNIEVRLDVTSALGAIGPEARRAIPVLVKAAQDKNSDLRNRAVAALVDIQAWDQGLLIRSLPR